LHLINTEAIKAFHENIAGDGLAEKRSNQHFDKEVASNAYSILPTGSTHPVNDGNPNKPAVRLLLSLDAAGTNVVKDTAATAMLPS
jgi:hypothetical protein